MVLAYIGLSGCLLLVFFQDWQHRQIHLALPLAILALALYGTRQPIAAALQTSMGNLLFFLGTLAILVGYMSAKHKRFLNPFQNYFGLGDLLFYVAITPLFGLRNYVLFFIFSMLFAIAMQFATQKISKHKSVPLAGFSALLLFLVLVKDSLLNFDKIMLL